MNLKTPWVQSSSIFKVKEEKANARSTVLLRHWYYHPFVHKREGYRTQEVQDQGPGFSIQGKENSILSPSMKVLPLPNREYSSTGCSWSFAEFFRHLQKNSLRNLTVVGVPILNLSTIDHRFKPRLPTIVSLILGYKIILKWVFPHCRHVLALL